MVWSRPLTAKVHFLQWDIEIEGLQSPPCVIEVRANPVFKSNVPAVGIDDLTNGGHVLVDLLIDRGQIWAS